MPPSERPRTLQTAAPPTNFSVTPADRIRALTAGAPAFMRRLREIEELVVAITRALERRRREAIATGLDAEAHARARAPMRAIGRLEDLVSHHNRFYPIEANLPIDARTGALRDRHGELWRPMPCPSLDDLLRMSAQRVDAPSNE